MSARADDKPGYFFKWPKIALLTSSLKRMSVSQLALK